MDEDSKIKEEIIYDIGKSLMNDKNAIEDVPALVDKSHKTVTETKVAEATSELAIHHKIEIVNREMESERQKNETYQKEQDEGYRKGANEVIDSQAFQIVCRNKRRKNFLTGTKIVLLLAFLFSLVSILFGSDEKSIFIVDFFNKNDGFIAAISFVLDMLIQAADSFFKESIELSTDKDVIAEKLKQMADI